MRGNQSIPTTQLSRPSPVPALPENEDGTEFDPDRVLHEIAEAGSRWKKDHLRKEDMEVRFFFFCLSQQLASFHTSELMIPCPYETQCYVYRLMVEWANLVAPISEVRDDPDA